MPDRSQQKHIWILPALLWAGISLLLIGCSLSAPHVVSSKSTPIPTITTVDTSTPTMHPDKLLASTLPGTETRLPGPSMTPFPIPTLHPVDATRVAHETGTVPTGDADSTDLVLRPTRTPRYYNPPGTPTPLITDLGIHQGGPGRSAFEGSWVNRWTEVVNGEYLTVWAGTFIYHRQAGVVWVETRTLDNLRNTSDSELYRTPLDGGSVRVIAANGLRLTLLAENGQQFIFDAGKRVWLATPSDLPPFPTVTIIAPRRCDSESFKGYLACQTASAQTRVAWATVLALTPTRTPQPTVTPIPTELALGIFPYTDPTWPTSVYVFENVWRGLQGDGYLNVYAGAYRDDPNQGVLFVMKRTKDYRQVMELSFHESPLKAGTLHIVNVDNEKITLGSSTGQQLTFDIGNRTWVLP